MPKKNQREKSWQDVSVTLSENIPAATETVTQKLSIYLLRMSNHIYLNSYIKLHSTHLLHVFVHMYVLHMYVFKKNMILQG